MARASSGADLLRRLRVRAGVSQQWLADVSGVSVRTIRDLENGRVGAPRGSSLRELAKGLQLGDGETRQLLGGWGTAGDALSLSEVAQNDDLNTLLASPELRVADDIRTLIAESHLTIRSRRVAENERRSVIRALDDGPLFTTQIFGGDQALDTADLILDQLYGCTLDAWLAPPNQPFVAYRVRFPSPLAAGQAHQFGFRASTDARYRRVSSRGVTLQDSDGDTLGLRRSTSAMTYSATFADELPAAVYSVTRIGREYVFGDPLPIDSTGTVTVTWENAPPGNYGLGWRWN